MRYHVSGLEDEGQSGTTFRAIVNNMYKDGNDGPKLVILENVESAPWDKMEEYINGRAKLAMINEKLKGAARPATTTTRTTTTTTTPTTTRAARRRARRRRARTS